MSYTVELTRKAEESIVGLYHYIRVHGPADPDKWQSGLGRYASLRSGRVSQECSVLLVRKCAVGVPYAICIGLDVPLRLKQES